MSRHFELGEVDLNLLYTFHLVSRLGGVGAAGRKLGRSQPAMSARLRQLERELGESLFERAGRRLVLSPVGRAVAGDVEQLLAAAQSVVDHARAAGPEPSGSLRIGALPTVSTYLLAPCLAEFLADNPAVEVEVATGLIASHIEPLLSGKLDLVVGVGPPPVERLEVVILGRVRPVFVQARAGRGRQASRVSRRALSRSPLLGFGQVGDLFFDEVWRYLCAAGAVIRLRVPHIQTLKRLVLLGAGASILPDYTVPEPEFTRRRIEGLTFSHPVWAAMRPSSRGIAAVRVIVESLKHTTGRRLER